MRDLSCSDVRAELMRLLTVQVRGGNTLGEGAEELGALRAVPENREKWGMQKSELSKASK